MIIITDIPASTEMVNSSLSDPSKQATVILSELSKLSKVYVDSHNPSSRGSNVANESSSGWGIIRSVFSRLSNENSLLVFNVQTNLEPFAMQRKVVNSPGQS